MDLIGNKINKSYDTLSTESSFGELSFFTGQNRNATAISNGFSKLYRIKRTDFINILKQHPDDFEMFCHIKDNLLVYKIYEALKLKCFGCGYNSHIV